MRRAVLVPVLLLLAGAARADDFGEDVKVQGQPLSKWLADIRGPNPEARYRAARVLRHVGPEADGAVAAMLLTLKAHDDVWVRTRVGLCLARLGPRQVPALAVALGLEDPGMSFAAARALGALGPQGRSAAPHLARSLTRTPSSTHRVVLALALWHTDRRPAALEALRGELRAAGGQHVWAAWALEQLGPAAAPAAAELVALLDSPEELTRRYALMALEGIGRPAVAPLAKALASDRPRLRVEALEALGRIGPDADEALPELIKHSRGPTSGARAAAARALGRVSAGDAALDALRKALRDADRDVRLEAASALRSLGPLAAPAADDLAEALRTAGPPVRRAVAAALRRIGRPAVKPLLALARDGDDLVRRAALDGLRDQAPDADALAALLAVARDGKDVLRPRAVTALAAFGKASAEALTALVADDAVRAEAVEALARLGPDAAAARQALTDALAHGDADARRGIIGALGGIGPAAGESAAALARLYDQDEALRLPLLAAFARMPGAAKEWLPAALKALKDERPLVRLEALAALAAAGTGAKAAVEDVRARLKDEVSVVRQSAGQVLVLLGEGKSLLPGVKEALEKGDAAQRQAALELVAWLGAEAKEVQAAVRERLKDVADGVRLGAAAALLEIDPGDDDAVTALVAEAKRRTGRGRVAAPCRLLGRCGPAAKAAVAALADAVLKERELPARLEAARALGEIGPEARPAADALLALLIDLERLPDDVWGEARDLDAMNRHKEVASGLGRGLADADLADAADAAVRAVRDKEPDALERHGGITIRVRDLAQEEVLQALVRIAPVAELAKQLEADLGERRALAARALARLGPKAKDAAALRGAATDGDARVAVEAARALAAQGEDALPALRTGLAAPPETAWLAAAGLADLGAKAKPALAELLAAAAAREPLLRREAVRALGTCDGDVKLVRPALERRLLDRDRPVRVAAALALERVAGLDPLPALADAARVEGRHPMAVFADLMERGDKARAALPALAEALEDRSLQVRVAAALAVARIGGKERDVSGVLLEAAVTSAVRPALRAAALRQLADGDRRGRYAVTDLARDAATPAEVREAARELLAKWK